MKKLLLVACIALGLGGCYNDKYDKLYPNPVVTCDTTTITYNNDIKPIIVASCYSPGNGCHDAAGTSGINFETDITMLQNYAASGRLVSDIDWTTNPMPKNGTKLPDCDINKIIRWANQGAPNN